MLKFLGIGTSKAKTRPTGVSRKSESRKKKEARDTQEAAAAKAAREARRAQVAAQKQYSTEAGRRHWEAYTASVAQEIKLKREARAAGNLYVPAAPKVFFVVRVKGLNKIPPKEKKILQLFRLRQVHNAVLIRNNKATMTMLRRVEPWVTYGNPSHAVIRKLVYKRGYAKIAGQRIPLCNNDLIEKQLGKFGIKCIEDLINELWTVGPNFKQANNFLWPFKLSSPRGGLEKKRHPYLEGGATGPRENLINDLAKRMI